MVKAAVFPSGPQPIRIAAPPSTPKGRLRILFLSKRFLYPMDTGGQIRTGKILEHLRDCLDITVISNVQSPKDDPLLPRMKAICTEFHAVRWTPIRKHTVRFYGSVLTKLFHQYPVAVIGDYSPALSKCIRDVLGAGHYDLLVCDYLHPSLNFRGITGYPTLLFQHNVESLIFQRHFETARSPLMRLFWWSQWRKMLRYEREACQQFTGVAAVSDLDKQILEGHFGARRVFVIPTGVDAEYFRPGNAPAEENTLVFTGSMDWLPNEDAILFFAEEILGRIKMRVPGVTLTLVGRNPSRQLLNRLRNHPEIRVTGWVKDIRPFVNRQCVYVVPLRIGGGTRIKVYEAMGMGKAVVSTRIGVEGLPVRDGEHVVLADRPEDFADAIVDLLQDGDKRSRIERAARAFVERNCNWERSAAAFREACHALTISAC
jgi:glycosyltransferase involved in cell wall biosynthesis